MRWTSSDNTLREPDASGSFFIEPRPSVSVIFRRSELKKILHTADNLNKQIHIVVMYLFFTTFFTYRNRKRIFHLCSRIGHSIRFFFVFLYCIPAFSGNHHPWTVKYWTVFCYLVYRQTSRGSRQVSEPAWEIQRTTRGHEFITEKGRGIGYGQWTLRRFREPGQKFQRNKNWIKK